MFSTTGENERSEGLFGAIFFETSPLPDGNVNASMGVDQPWILALLFLFISMVCIATRFCFGRLKAYKKSLQSSHENSSN